MPLVSGVAIGTIPHFLSALGLYESVLKANKAKKLFRFVMVNLKAFDIALTDDDLHHLDEVSRSPARYPGWIQSYNAKGRVPQGYEFEGATWSLGERPI